MSEKKDRFRECWERTEIIRQYQRMLYTFGDTELGYLFVAQHSFLSDRTVVRRGILTVKKPHILLPGSDGPEFMEGFQDEKLPEDAAYIIRSMRLPYSNISNRPLSQEQIEYEEPDEVLEKLDKELEAGKDRETGLVKGVSDGMTVSLMRYCLGLMLKSAPGNVEHFFEHTRRQQGRPISPNERVTDEDIRRLFEAGQ